MSSKNTALPLSVSLVVAAVILMVGNATASQTVKIADTETLLIQSESPPTGTSEHITGTDLYAVTASAAQQLAGADNSEVFPVQNYRQQLTPNDPLEIQTYMNLLDGQELWDTTTGSNGTTIAVVDSGFALQHEDLAGRWRTNSGEQGITASEGAAPNCTSRSLALDKSCNNLDDDSNGFIDDWRGWDFAYDDNSPQAGSVQPTGSGASHGTAVAGLSGATGNNTKGVASLNWQVNIMPLQVFTDTGTATTLEVAEAVAYAMDNGADVINLSLGSIGSDPALENLLQDAVNAGIIVIAAAGNCGDTNYAEQGCSYQGQMLYPATSSSTIAVAATTLADTRAPFSSQGSSVDLAAPGSGAINTPLYLSTNQLTAYSGTVYGTSFASPIVASTAALVRDAWPTASVRQIRSILIDSSYKTTDMSGQQFTNQLGFGRLRPHEAVQLATNCAGVARSEDINCDGSIGILDLSSLASQWGLSNTGRSDINSSNKTDILDLSSMASKWGQ